MPGEEAGLGAHHLPFNHWLGVQVYASSSARAKQQVAISWAFSHLCCYSSAANVIWSPVDGQLERDAVPQHEHSTSSVEAEADSLAVYTYIPSLNNSTEVSGMVLTSDVPRYTHAALQLLSYLRHPSLRTPATPQPPAAVGDTQVTINIFTTAHPAGLASNEAPRSLNVQYTVTLTTRWFENGTSIANAAPPPTAVALQPWVQWTDLVMDDVFLYGMCLIEDALVSNESFTSQTDGADQTGQCTLTVQSIDRYSQLQVKLYAAELAKHCCMLLQTVI